MATSLSFSTSVYEMIILQFKRKHRTKPFLVNSKRTDLRCNLYQAPVGDYPAEAPITGGKGLSPMW
jgi:hypothetical protein